MSFLSKLFFWKWINLGAKQKPKKTVSKPNKVVETLKKDLILRERLALQRTILANQSTFLAFLRTAMYFSIAGLSTRNLLQIERSLLIEIVFYGTSLFILIYGIVNFFRHKKMIEDNNKHIGDYQLEYYE